MRFSGPLFVGLVLAAAPFTWGGEAYIGGSGQVAANISLLAGRSTEVQELLRASFEKTKTKNLSEFLAKIGYCDNLVSDQTAAVQQRRLGRRAYLPRDLEDLIKTEGAPPDLDTIEKIYLPRAKMIFGSKNEPGTYIAWKPETDLLAAEQTTIEQTICLKRGINSLEAALSLIHELVHFIKRPDDGVIANVADFENFDQFAINTILAPGDEVDAFILQFQLIVLLKGRGSLPDQRVAAFYSPAGVFNGDRHTMAKYILGPLHYRNVRMESEYKSLLTGAYSNETRKHGILLSLINLRNQQEKTYAEQAKVLSATKSQEIDAEIAQRLSRAAAESRTRAMASLAASQKKRDMLRKKLQAIGIVVQ